MIKTRPIDYSKFLIGVVFIAGLFTLNADLHDDHSWRQAIGMMVAHNFYESGINLFYPLYDICGAASPDAFATELPLLNVLIVSLYELFGEHVFLARLVNWFVSLVGLFYFSKFIEKITDDKLSGFYTVVIILGSLYTMFARKVMPDTFSMSLVMIGVYYYDKYLREDGILLLIGGFLFYTLGILSKIPSIVLMGFLLFPYLDTKLPYRQKALTALSVLLGLVIMYAWYFQWLPYLQDHTTCFPLIYPVTLEEGWRIFLDTYDKVFFRFHINAFQWPIPYYVFIIAIILALIKKEWKKLIFLFSTSLLFLLFIVKTGGVFQGHNYYVLPFIPIMAFFIGDFFNKYIKNQRVAALFLIIFFTVGSIKNMEDLSLNAYPHYARIADILDEKGVQKSDLIIVDGGNMSPVFMYFTKRKGWAVNEDVLTQYTWMPDYKSEGLQYIVFDRNIAGKELSLDYELIYEDKDFKIYKP